MLKLLSGLVGYHGSILFNDVELEHFSRESQNFIGYLPQDVLMVPETVAENISSLRDPNSSRIVEVARLVGIHDFILNFQGDTIPNYLGVIKIYLGVRDRELGWQELYITTLPVYFSMNQILH